MDSEFQTDASVSDDRCSTPVNNSIGDISSLAPLSPIPHEDSRIISTINIKLRQLTNSSEQLDHTSGEFSFSQHRVFRFSECSANR